MQPNQSSSTVAPVSNTSGGITTGINHPEVRKIVKAFLVAVLTVAVNYVLNVFHVNPALLGGVTGIVYYLATQIESLIPTKIG